MTRNILRIVFVLAFTVSVSNQSLAGDPSNVFRSCDRNGHVWDCDLTIVSYLAMMAVTVGVFSWVLYENGKDDNPVSDEEILLPDAGLQFNPVDRKVGTRFSIRY